MRIVEGDSKQRFLFMDKGTETGGFLIDLRLAHWDLKSHLNHFEKFPLKNLFYHKFSYFENI